MPASEGDLSTPEESRSSPVPPVPPYTSHLFMVRVWREVISHTETEWRGRLQHVQSGQAFYFRDWSALLENLLAMLPDGGAPHSATAGRRDGRLRARILDARTGPVRAEADHEDQADDDRGNVARERKVER